MSTLDSDRAGWWSRALGPLLITLLACLLYGQVLTFDFVSYDDYDLVAKNESFLSDPAAPFISFTTHVFTTHRSVGYYYRPLLLLSYIVDYRVWGLNPAGYHLTNLLLHLMAAFTVYAIARRLVANRAAAAAAGALFAVHPIQTESVAWIAGRNDILLGLFLFLMVLCLLRRRDEPRRRFIWSALAALMFTVALFTKEAAVFFILIPPLVDFLLVGEPIRSFFRRENILRYGIFGAILGVYLGVRLAVFGVLVGAESMYGSPPLSGRLKLLPALFGEHVGLLLAPLRLSIVRPVENMLWLGPVWGAVAVLVLVAAAALLWIAWKKDRILAFGGVWVAVGLLPVLNIFPVAVPILEHRLYTAAGGIAFMAASLIAVLGKDPTRRRLVLAVAWGVILLAAAVSMFRVPVWKNSETLWTDAIAKAPRVSRSYFNLAGWYFERGMYTKTIVLMEQYTGLWPEDVLGHIQLRRTYLLAGRVQDALRISHSLVILQPRNQSRYLEAGSLFEQLGSWDSASVLYREGLTMDSTFHSVRLALAKLEERRGNLARAAEQYENLARLEPSTPDGHFGLARVEALRGHPARALEAIERGLESGPPPEDIRRLLEKLRSGTRRPGGLP